MPHGVRLAPVVRKAVHKRSKAEEGGTHSASGNGNDMQGIDAARARVKVRQLIALATNHAAREEEARTAAVQAARLIAKHDLLAVSDVPRLAGTAQGRSIRLKFSALCLVCDRAIAAGSRAFWSKGEGCVHMGCLP